MEKQNNSDIAAFPELFDGIDQFITEQGNDLKRASIRLAGMALLCGMLLAWLLHQAS